MKNRIKNIFKKSKFSFIMSIVSFVIINFLILLISENYPLKERLIIILTGYILFMLFLIITILIVRFYDRKVIKINLTIITGILTILLMIYFSLSFSEIILFDVDNPITDINSYEDEVSGVLLKVFPKKIPDNVDNIEFYYAPGILQGGTNYVLYYIDKTMTKEKFNKKYKNKAIWIGHKEEYTKKRGLLDCAFNLTPAKYNNENDFIIYLVEGRCDDSGYCNHGNYLFAAFNDKTTEVVYKYEQW